MLSHRFIQVIAPTLIVHVYRDLNSFPMSANSRTFFFLLFKKIALNCHKEIEISFLVKFGVKK